MLVCRKCQRRHPDGTATCGCGADLRRDGITIPDRAPLVDAGNVPGLDPLPPLRPPSPSAGSGPPAPVAPAPAPERSAAPAAPPAPRTGTRPDAGPPPPPPAGRRDRRRRGAEPGDVARGPRVAGGDGAGAAAAPPVHDGTGTAATGPDAPPRLAVPGAPGSARGRGATPEELRPADDPDRPNAHGDVEPDAADAGGPGAGGRAPRQDEVACPRCLDPNAATRRFCQSCGETLPAFRNTLAGERDADDTPTEPRNTLWRRLTGTTYADGRDNRTWRQRARDAGHGRIRYDRALSPKARAAMAGGAVGVVAAVVLAVGPFQDDLRGLVADDGGRSPVGARFDPLDVDGAAVDPTITGHEAQNAIDGNPDTSAGFELTADGQPLGAVLVLDLGSEVELRRLSVSTGEPTDDPEVALFPRPHRVLLCAQGGPCHTADLRDTPEGQRLELAEPITAQVLTIEVQSVHLPPRGGQFIRLTTIREVTVG